jgi:hypothetical protein
VSAPTPGQAAYEARMASRAALLGHAYGIGMFNKPWHGLDEQDQAHEETGAQAAIDVFLAGDSVSAESIREALAAQEPKPAPASLCSYWSDPSDDFYGVCVKDAYHDREGDPEHENEHGIRWTGKRWEGVAQPKPELLAAHREKGSPSS